MNSTERALSCVNTCSVCSDSSVKYRYPMELVAAGLGVQITYFHLALVGVETQ